MLHTQSIVVAQTLHYCLTLMPEWNFYRQLNASNMKYLVFKSLGAPDTVAIRACTSATLSWKIPALAGKWKKHACVIMALKRLYRISQPTFPYASYSVWAVSLSLGAKPNETQSHTWVRRSCQAECSKYCKFLVWLLLKSPQHFRGKHRWGKQPGGEIILYSRRYRH